MRILIADSDEELLHTLQSYLRKRGHEVQLATNGIDCVLPLRDSVPEVVVLDHGLLWGGCDGVLTVLRDDPLLAIISVILIADSQPQYDAQGATNIVAWLQKPFSLSDLVTQLSSASDPFRLPGCSSVPAVRHGRDDDCGGARRVLLPRLNPKQAATHRRMWDYPR